MKSVHTVITNEGTREVYSTAASTLSFATMKTAERWAAKIEQKTGVKCTPAYRQTTVGGFYYLIASDYIPRGTRV